MAMKYLLAQDKSVFDKSMGIGRPKRVFLRLERKVFSYAFAILALCICPTALQASPICERWIAERDDDFFTDYTKLTDRYAASVSAYSLWLSEFDEFEDANFDTNLKRQKFYDFLLLGFKLTGDVVSVTGSLSGSTAQAVATPVVSNINSTSRFTEILAAENVEEAAAAHFKRQSGVKNFISSLTIIQALLDAKDRFADRDDTIQLIRNARLRLARELRNAQRRSDAFSNQLEFQTSFKNAMDGQCSNLTANAENCLAIGKHERTNSHEVRNTCSESVFVFWCVKDDRDNRCGERAHFYAYSKSLRPGGTTYNQFSLPIDDPIEIGACPFRIGSFGRNVVVGADGAYYCLMP